MFFQEFRQDDGAWRKKVVVEWWEKGSVVVAIILSEGLRAIEIGGRENKWCRRRCEN
ncbi:hypothetical protein A2U01_0010771 [Trifolium medium]|uniref:Uncharacterized protein n=1 Tax=Trifolium medium TaxID=97028 RepID=A0A392MQT7_9FABA|nr:hypothetical protein [Trifolium medium]